VFSGTHIMVILPNASQLDVCATDPVLSGKSIEPVSENSTEL
jgi:hypothetical protein